MKPLTRAPHWALIALAGAGAAMMASVAMSAAGWVWSLGDSTPHYLFRPSDSDVDAPAWVRFELSHPYLDGPVSVIKRVVCRPGQTLIAQASTDTCDGRVVARPKTTTLDGRPLSAFVFAGPVPVGKLFVANPHPDSFDSRYFGFVDLASTRSMVPVW